MRGGVKSRFGVVENTGCSGVKRRLSEVENTG